MKRMKRMMGLLLAALCLAGLAACGSKTRGDSQPWTQEQAQAVLDSGAFTEELTAVDETTAFALYHLGDYDLNAEQMSACFVRKAAGESCEELALLTFEDDAAAQAAGDALKDYVQSQIDANEGYRPAGVANLKNAWNECRGNTVLLVVAGDLDAAKAAVA